MVSWYKIAWNRCDEDDFSQELLFHVISAATKSLHKNREFQPLFRNAFWDSEKGDLVAFTVARFDPEWFIQQLLGEYSQTVAQRFSTPAEMADHFSYFSKTLRKKDRWEKPVSVQ